jgi:hypothetical protein
LIFISGDSFLIFDLGIWIEDLYVTAHSLHSLEALRTLSFYFFFLSAERAERKKQHPFGSGMKAGKDYEHTGR